MQALYARVDMAKKQKTRGSEGSGSPWSPGQVSGSPDAETSCTSPAGQQTGPHETGTLGNFWGSYKVPLLFLFSEREKIHSRTKGDTL